MQIPRQKDLMKMIVVFIPEIRRDKTNHIRVHRCHLHNHCDHRIASSTVGSDWLSHNEINFGMFYCLQRLRLRLGIC